MKEVAVLLHNIRSSHNVGSIFRTADAAGVKKVYLSGYTPRPVDRFGREQKEIAKTALGAERFLTWEYAPDAKNIIDRLKREGWTIVAVEQDERSKDYRSFDAHEKTLFIFGNEVRGLSPQLIRRCDSVLEIPMAGKKESLNISVSAGIILFQCASR